MIAELVAFIGIPAGLIIMRASKEEQKAAVPFFALAEYIFLVGIFTILFYARVDAVSIGLMALTAIIVWKIKQPSAYVFPLLAIVIFLSSTRDILFLQSVLIFLYGLVVASHYIDFKKKNYVSILVSHSPYLVILVLLLSVESMF
ncbi:MAG TPA: hypothetical protein VJH97_05250 [Candidatus Nanoarchaeia archaeon]|nr:hypothetical protein [Candidatus Nanoarchaeia archaeon]